MDIILLSQPPHLILRKGILFLQHLISKLIMKEAKPNEFQLMEAEHPEVYLSGILCLLRLQPYLCWLGFGSLFLHFPSLCFLSKSYKAYSLVTLSPGFQFIIVITLLTQFLGISLHNSQ